MEREGGQQMAEWEVGAWLTVRRRLRRLGAVVQPHVIPRPCSSGSGPAHAWTGGRVSAPRHSTVCKAGPKDTASPGPASPFPMSFPAPFPLRVQDD